MRILVRPCYSDFLKNRLFELKHEYGTHWMEPYARLRSALTAMGWEMATWDMHPLETADAIYWQDLPATRQEVQDARKRAPRAKFILQLLESPLSRPHFFDPRNHDLFDAILTYNPHLCDGQRYFRYYLPLGTPSSGIPDPPFSERRPLVLINSNRSIGIWNPRQSGLEGLPFFGILFSGWNISPIQLLTQNRGEQYSHRRHIARIAERQFPDLLDIYGPGWSGEQMSWVHRFIPRRPYANCKGRLGAKSELLFRYRFILAFENMVGDAGYISEKILDALYFGAVPIYLGDEHIAEIVPPDCFIDARQFKNDADLLSFVERCSETEWRRLREAGDRARTSSVLDRFQSDAFIDAVIQVLSRVMGANPPRQI